MEAFRCLETLRRQLQPAAAGVQAVAHEFEALAVEPLVRLDPAHVLEHEVAGRGEDRPMPGVAFGAGTHEIVDCPTVLMHACDHARIDRLLQAMRDPVTDDAGFGENVEFAVGDLRPGNAHGAQPLGQPALRVQHQLVIVGIHHRLHMQPARQPERALHRQPVVDRRVLEVEMREDVVRLERKLRSAGRRNGNGSRRRRAAASVSVCGSCGRSAATADGTSCAHDA